MSLTQLGDKCYRPCRYVVGNGTQSTVTGMTYCNHFLMTVWLFSTGTVHRLSPPMFSRSRLPFG